MMPKIAVSLLILVATSGFCQEAEVPNVRKRMDIDVLTAYRTTCLRLRSISNWMSVLFRLKSAWTNTITKEMLESPLLSQIKSKRNLTPVPKRRHFEEKESECSSLRNIQTTFQTFAHLQGQLLQLSAVLGTIALKRGEMKLNESLSVKNQMRNFALLNRTTLSKIGLLKEMRMLTTSLMQSNTTGGNSFRNLQNVPKLLGYFQDQANDIVKQLLLVAKRSGALNQTENLVHSGGFFQNVGKTLDNFFT